MVAIRNGAENDSRSLRMESISGQTTTAAIRMKTSAQRVQSKKTLRRLRANPNRKVHVQSLEIV